jgi:citrate synthase
VLLRFYRSFHHNAHPMAMVATIVASLAAFYHDSTNINNDRHREIFSHRMIAKIPTIAAASYKHALGQPFIYPRNDLDYTANVLNMLFSVPCEPYEVDPLHAKALDLLFILHADHEQNASTSTVRLAGSTGCNPYTAMSAGVSALWGPAHGGANEAVVDMLEKIGDVSHVPDFLARVKDKAGGVRLMGFGHRVYKNFDPRATIIREMAHQVLGKLGQSNNPLFELALRSRRSRSRTITSSAASCIRMSISILGSSTGRSASRARCSRSCSRSPARRAGSRTGRR